jgi:hypothetical protein
MGVKNEHNLEMGPFPVNSGRTPAGLENCGKKPAALGQGAGTGGLPPSGSKPNQSPRSDSATATVSYPGCFADA